jgi:alkanesulfonate monooxygenase SsuD/methylene tetrahydromethanopterin reductase-like flavin-dependent oxidoreductase (luciferase family)
VILGGAGPRRTPRLAAQYADEFNMAFRDLAETEAGFGRVRDACTAAGRDPGSMRFSAAHTVVCGKDDAEVGRRASAIGWSPEDLRTQGITGTPAQVVDTIGEFGRAGADTIYLQVLDLSDLDHLELLAADVLPQV